MTNGPETDCISESELDRLGTEELVAYMAEQRDSGRPECAKRAMAVLAWGYWDFVCVQVAVKVETQDVEDVGGAALESALRSSFQGKSVGEFVNWLKVIVSRRIADYHRSREREPDIAPLVGEHGDEEEIFGDEPYDADESGAIAVREVTAKVLEERNEVHQRVIRCYGPNPLGFLDLSARETVSEVERLHPGQTMSEDNVHQIYKRFKDDLSEELGLGGS